MTTDKPLHRRRILRMTGGLAAMGLAGCIGSSTDGLQAINDPSNDQPGANPEPTADSNSGSDSDSDSDHMEGDGHGHEESGHDDDGHEESGHDNEDGDEDTPEGHTPGDDPHSHEDVGHLHDETVDEPVDHATVEMVTTNTGFHFEPHVARVNVGGTVTFVNESGSHSATAYHPDYDVPLRIPEGATPWDSGLMTEAGAEFEHTFETEGVYQYYCIPHEAMGMIAAIIVGEPDPHDQPGLEPPQERFSGRAAEKIEQLNEMCNEALGHTHG